MANNLNQYKNREAKSAVALYPTNKGMRQMICIAIKGATRNHEIVASFSIGTASLSNQSEIRLQKEVSMLV